MLLEIFKSVNHFGYKLNTIKDLALLESKYHPIFLWFILDYLDVREKNHHLLQIIMQKNLQKPEF